MHKRIAALRLWLVKLYVHFFVHVDPKAKCPACGHRRKHKIQFSPNYQAVIHQCGACNAAWGEKPLVEAQQWAIELPQEREPEKEMHPAFGAPREPQRAK